MRSNEDARMENEESTPQFIALLVRTREDGLLFFMVGSRSGKLLS